MANDGEDDLHGEEDEEDEEEEAITYPKDIEMANNPLASEAVAENLSLLCKTGNGLAHAFVRLDVRNKGLTDISILNCYVHLRYLDLSNNGLRDISAVNALPHLLTLKVDHNMLTSARLEELQYLQVASFANNQITSTEGIAHPLLETLNISSNKIRELTGLTRQNLPSLRSLDLHGNELSSIQNLHIPTLRQLFLASNNLSSIDGLSGLPQLTTLHLRNNHIATLDGFTSDLESLQYINMRTNKIAELSEVDKLKCLPYLRALSLLDCPICDVEDYRIEVLVRLRKLERLDKDQYTDDERGDAEDIHSQRQAEAKKAAEAAEEES
ncbi:PREDICTED: leucine-rich repeat-containing protein 23-like [Amphimedon queenslandica]|uniref:U2A'/phosphoprotein 32 family A C-terminal domain-containing protein n=1 Tax=Amphimedon queenslandica TaxID=400682 RepID=A0A1X7VMX6_AMPQE|nr:PREDICTED: leucine-rich repeat-containing protein 23-like [Amphimedon queenslandica]|eukprot:XP_011409661.1 PREDICTED: leucine-rich repeat-containing protein 23-like [Amphimedon queenslandica]